MIFNEFEKSLDRNLLFCLISNWLKSSEARLMTLLAAHKMDTVGNKKAAREIAMIKVIAPNMCEKVVDYAEQGKDFYVRSMT